MSVREELGVISSKWPCQTAWSICSEIYMEMHVLWFILTGYSRCCFKYFSRSFHSRWSISALLVLSINLKHGNDNMATSCRTFVYLVKWNQSGQWSFWSCHQQVLRELPLVAVLSFSLLWWKVNWATALWRPQGKNHNLILELEWTFYVGFCKLFFPFCGHCVSKGD